MLALSPNPVVVQAEAGTEGSFRVSATILEEAASQLHHVEFDASTDDLTTFNVLSQTATRAELEFYTSSALAIGEHKGTLSFYLCKDENCRTTIEGSPFLLPYTITVRALQAPTVAPTALSVNAEVDAAKEVSISAVFSAPTHVAFGLSDSAGHFSSEFLTTQSGATYTLTLRVLPPAAVGTFSGVLSLTVCRTTPCSTHNQVTNAPLTIPYTLTVTPEVLLAPVPTASGLPEWETHQGNAAHTGHVPVTLNATLFTPRWTWTAPADAVTTLSPAATGSGKAVVSMSGYFNEASVIAFNESDGAIAWRHDYGRVFAANHPAVYGGRVFVATSGHEDTAMWSFDLADGTVKSRTNFSSQWEHYLAPTVLDGHVFTNGGSYGGMYSFRALTGSSRWFAPLQQYDLWTPAVDSRYAYGHTGYEFAAVDRRTGERAFSIANPSFNWNGYSLNTAPVIAGDGSVLVVDGIYAFAHPNQLIRYDVVNRVESWRIGGSFVSNPVVAGDRLYVLNSSSNQLEARDVSTGALLWAWVVADAQESLPVGNLIVTDNLIFLCTNKSTYAISLTSHTAVWTRATTGHLAMSSNEVLYVVAPKKIDAFSLD